MTETVWPSGSIRKITAKGGTNPSASKKATRRWPSCDLSSFPGRLEQKQSRPAPAEAYGLALMPKTLARFVVESGAAKVTLTTFFVLSVGMIVS